MTKPTLYFSQIVTTITCLLCIALTFPSCAKQPSDVQQSKNSQASKWIPSPKGIGKALLEEIACDKVTDLVESITDKIQDGYDLGPKCRKWWDVVQTCDISIMCSAVMSRVKAGVCLSSFFWNVTLTDLLPDCMMNWSGTSYGSDDEVEFEWDSWLDLSAQCGDELYNSDPTCVDIEPGLKPSGPATDGDCTDAAISENCAQLTNSRCMIQDCEWWDITCRLSRAGGGGRFRCQWGDRQGHGREPDNDGDWGDNYEDCQEHYDTCVHNTKAMCCHKENPECDSEGSDGECDDPNGCPSVQQSPCPEWRDTNPPINPFSS